MMVEMTEVRDTEGYFVWKMLFSQNSEQGGYRVVRFPNQSNHYQTRYIVLLKSQLHKIPFSVAEKAVSDDISSSHIRKHSWLSGSRGWKGPKSVSQDLGPLAGEPIAVNAAHQPHHLIL